MIYKECVMSSQKDKDTNKKVHTPEEQALQKQRDRRTQATAMRNALGLTASQQALQNIRCEGCDD